jgi:multicomponent Na+:H+ antiporter subunit B
MTPFIQMFGLYIIFHGHLSPGGGFQGGAIIGASMILLAVVFGIKEGDRHISHDASILLESLSILYIFVGLIGVFLGYSFLSNGITGIGLGRQGELISGGFILALNIVIGLKVASTGKTLFYSLVKEEV